MMRWRDWKGDLVPAFSPFSGEPIRVTIPDELANETALLTYLEVSARELKKIWYYRGRMYRHFSIAKRPNKVRLGSVENQGIPTTTWSVIQAPKGVLRWAGSA